MQKIKYFFVVILEILATSILFWWLNSSLENNIHHEINTILPILLDIAFLAIFASFGGRLAKLLGIAPMAGQIVVGVMIGPALLNVVLPHAGGVELVRLAGVLFILFEAGLHFDMNLLKQNIKIATLVAFSGVLIPLLAFTALGHYFLHLDLVAAVFLGGIFTATSVGLSVEALKSAGKLSSNMGNKIIGAAVIDDILGVLLLTILSKMSEGHLEPVALIWILVTVVLFFVATYLMWSLKFANRVINYLDKHYKTKLDESYTRFFFGALIFAASFMAIVGLEPVLGAFGIGVVLSKIDNEIKHKTWEKIEGYIHIFVGGFLVSIGTLLNRDALVSAKAWVLALVFTLLAFLTKYAVKYLFKDKKEGKLVGYAMSIRGEVGLVFVAVAIASGVLSPEISAAAFLAVVLVTILGAVLFEKNVSKV